MTKLGDLLLEQLEQRARERAERLRGMLLDEKAAALDSERAPDLRWSGARVRLPCGHHGKPLKTNDTDL